MKSSSKEKKRSRSEQSESVKEDESCRNQARN